MNYKKINEGGVLRDDGVLFQIKHPDYLEYYDGQNMASVSIDFDPITKQIKVYASDVHEWLTPNGYEEMTSEKKQELTTTLVEGIKLLDGNFIVV